MSLGIPIAAGVLYPFFGVLLSPIIAGAAMSFVVCQRDRQCPAFACSPALTSDRCERSGITKGVADEVRAIGRKATTFRADVSKRDNVYAAIAHAEKELGGFDIMVNNAGITQIQPLADVTPEEFHNIMQVNVAGVLWGIQAAAKKFKKRKQKGKIISASSIAGHEGFPLLGTLLGEQVRSPRADAGGSERISRATASRSMPTAQASLAQICGWRLTGGWLKSPARRSERATRNLSAVSHSAERRRRRTWRLFVSYLAGPDSDYMTGQAPLIDGGLVYR